MWNLVVSSWQHLRRFGHYPDWQSFNGWLICERCLKPPKPPRKRVLVPVPARLGL